MANRRMRREIIRLANVCPRLVPMKAVIICSKTLPDSFWCYFTVVVYASSFISRLRWALSLLLLCTVTLAGFAARRTAAEILAERASVLERMQVVPYKRVPDVITMRRNQSGRLVRDRKIDHLDLRLSILRPSDADDGELRPVILFFHGGGFRTGPPAQFFLQADLFAARGAVAMCVEYRLKGEVEVTIAQQVSDARAAIRWVRRNAAALQVDPDRVIAAGGSAGGYLALASAVLPGADAEAIPNAIVAFNPAIDFASFAENQGVESLEASLGGSIDLLSCTPHLRPGLPPVILFQGEVDEVTPLAVAQKFTDRAHALNLTCELVTFPRLGHGSFNRDPYIENTVRQASRFLSQQGFKLSETEAP